MVQLVKPGKGDSPAEPSAVLGLPMADRAQVRRLGLAKSLIEKKNYAEAVMILGEILKAPSDCSFRPDDRRPLYRRLNPEAERVLIAWPPEGLAQSESLFGPAARSAFQAASMRGREPIRKGVARCSC